MDFWELTLFRLSGFEFSEVRQALASNLETPSEALQILSRDTDTLVLGSLVCNPNTPIRVLCSVALNRALIDDWLARFKAGFAFDAELLWALFNLGDGDLESAIAQHPAAPPELLKRIARDGCDAYCREDAANNPNANAEVLWELRGDTGMYGFLTQHPKATAELLEYIANTTLRSEGLEDMWFTGQMRTFFRIRTHREGRSSLL